MNLANGRVSTFETIIPKGWCNVRWEGYTELLYNAFGDVQRLLVNVTSLTGADTLRAQKILHR